MARAADAGGARLGLRSEPLQGLHGSAWGRGRGVRFGGGLRSRPGLALGEVRRVRIAPAVLALLAATAGAAVGPSRRWGAHASLGHLRWSFLTRGDVDAPLVMGPGGVLYAGSDDG